MSNTAEKTGGGLLQLESCTIRFGGLTAVAELNLEIGANELRGLIGPNGAGKTTVFNLITGVYQPTEGAIRFGGQPLRDQSSHAIARRGIARTFQNIRLFPSLTVFDNVRAALSARQRRGVVRSLWRGRAFHANEAQVEREVLELLEIFNLARFRHSLARNLP